MTAAVAVAERNGEKETRKEGNEGQVVKTLVHILRSWDHENAFLDAVSDGVIPDEVCLELAEHLGELVKAMDFDNQLDEFATALYENGAISEKTEQYLLLAILEMDEQEEVSAYPVAPLEADGTGAPAETKTPIQALTPQSDLVAAGQAPESPAPVPQAPLANYLSSTVQLAKLQTQFGVAEAVPEQELRQFQLTEEEFETIRQQLGSEVLAQAELEPGQRRRDIPSSLEVISLVQTVWEMAREDKPRDFATAQSLGRRQAELTRACFTAYEVLVSENFRLIHRNRFDRPLMTVSSIALLRDRFQSHEKDRLSAQSRKTLDALEIFELGVIRAEERKAAREGREPDPKTIARKNTILRQRATREREPLIRAGIRSFDAVSEELVAALPKTKERALQQVWDYLCAKRNELTSKLRTAGSTVLGEAEATIRRILDLHSAAVALRREMAELEASDYDRATQRPTLSDRDKQLVLFELERKELDSIRLELETALKEGVEANRNRKRLQILSAITASKLRELDQLIAGLRPAPELEVRHV